MPNNQSNPSKVDLRKFYEDNRPLFEVTAGILVLATLVLNIVPPKGLAGDSIKFVQFSLLLGSCPFLFVIIRKAIGHFTKPYFDEVRSRLSAVGPQNKPSNWNDIKEAVVFAIERVGLVIVLIFLGFLFMFGLILYTILTYLTQFYFLIFSTICYTVFILSLRMIPVGLLKYKYGAKLLTWYTVAVIFILGFIPAGAYLILFSSGALTWMNIIISVGFGIVISILLLTLLILTDRGLI